MRNSATMKKHNEMMIITRKAIEGCKSVNEMKASIGLLGYEVKKLELNKIIKEDKHNQKIDISNSSSIDLIVGEVEEGYHLAVFIDHSKEVAYYFTDRYLLKDTKECSLLINGNVLELTNYNKVNYYHFFEAVLRLTFIVDEENTISIESRDKLLDVLVSWGEYFRDNGYYEDEI